MDDWRILPLVPWKSVAIFALSKLLVCYNPALPKPGQR